MSIEIVAGSVPAPRADTDSRAAAPSQQEQSVRPTELSLTWVWALLITCALLWIVAGAAVVAWLL